MMATLHSDRVRTLQQTQKEESWSISSLATPSLKGSLSPTLSLLKKINMMNVELKDTEM